LQRSERAVLQAETQMNRQNFVFQTKVEGIGFRANTYTNYKSEMFLDIPGSLDYLAGETYELRIGFDPEGKQTDFPGKPNLHVISERGPFTLSDGVINFSGSPLPDVPNLDTIEQELIKKSSIQHGRPGTLKIIADLRRVGIESEVTRAPGAAEPVWYTQPTDPIPTEASNVLKSLNGLKARQNISSTTSSALMNSAIYGVAKRIHKENPDVHLVRVQPVTNIDRSNNESKRNTRFEIECIMKDGRNLSAYMVPGNKEEAEFSGYLRTKSIAMTEIGRMMSEHGANPTKACDQIFDKGADRPKRSNSMEGLQSINQEIYRANSYTTSVLSTLSAQQKKSADDQARRTKNATP